MYCIKVHIQETVEDVLRWRKSKNRQDNPPPKKRKKEKSTKEQTMIYITLHRKAKIEQHGPH